MKQSTVRSHLIMHRTIGLTDYIGRTNGMMDYRANAPTD